MASLHFYRYFFEQDDKRTNYNLINLLDYISHLDIQKRAIKLKTHWYTLINNYVPRNNTSVRFFQISKSINHAYTGYLGIKLRLFRNELYSYVSCLLIPFYHLLIAYQPQNSPYTNEIASYFMSYIDTEFSNRNLKLNISPIVYNLTLNDLTPAYKIKDIQVSFDPGNIKHTNSLLSGLSQVLNYYISNKKDYTVNFKINNIHNKSINYALVCNLINQIQDDNSNIKKLSLRVKGPNDYKYNKIGIDRKNSGDVLLPFNINNRNSSSKYIYAKMIHCYKTGHLPKGVNRLNDVELTKFINHSNIRFIDNPKNDFFNINKIK